MGRRRIGGRGGLALAAALLATGPARADVQVRYTAPERFTDAENRFGSGQPLRVTLAELTRIFQDLGNAKLRPGERLDVTVLDIDLAGFDRPGLSTPTGVRVVTDATPPRIRFAYALRRDGRIVAQGEETVTDINFLLTSNPRFSTGGLYYERQLLRDWFARRFPENG
ncbi:MULTISPECIES: DUF3016 domain-containing protein [Methylobacterium]|uniref:DUF3016 domain-containing protein n=1 Tax=Methylobacterium longum TaxID=767694 RepID=A0ABT8AL00_9HYPH|nr:MULTISPECIES: DUF3016 domain-containing protein [Methylobacterium]MCJ2098045.1 DUF3016 domain-containing protein [Methylobacterium sp. E-046]MDN3570501.1 DUF3016 domain-containing protein [Methylobacterium longum]GJE14032.1 hypothetical protein FOHLNKBM_5101 [Methylobacterium longum]